MSASTTVYQLDHASKVAEARRAAEDLARAAGLKDTAVGRAAVVTTELANNLIKFSQDGVLQLRLCSEHTEPLLEVLAVDSGPGMQDIQQSLTDGVSTSGTSGTGLGAVRRLSAGFDIMSQPGKGTIVVARVGNARGETPQRFTAGIFQSPAPGESVCGDACAIVPLNGKLVIIVADGLGHGPAASTASDAACEYAREHASLEPVELLPRIHDALRPTRGAAVSIATIDLQTRRILYAGVGNISGVILGSNRPQHMVSYNGTAGHEMRKTQQFDYALPLNASVVLHSDGVSSRWESSLYPSAARYHAALLAGILHRDYGRGRDDATVVVIGGIS